MIKAVIFDLDGVLVSTDKLHFEAWKRLAEELHIKGFTEEDNIRQRGVSRMESLNVLLEKTTAAYSDEQKDALCVQKNEYYKEMLSSLDKNALLAGAVETVEGLKKKGILIGIGSVSRNTPEILRRTGLAKLIDKVSCGLDIQNSKPDPEVFLVAAKKLGIAPEHCLVVEDADVGIIAAKAGGMKAMGVGPAQYHEKADYGAPSLAAPIEWDTIL
ncbi:MAG: beta-phosphoglucomutase [Acetanaerobacterium sp.]